MYPSEMAQHKFGSHPRDMNDEEIQKLQEMFKKCQELSHQINEAKDEEEEMDLHIERNLKIQEFYEYCHDDKGSIKAVWCWLTVDIFPNVHDLEPPVPHHIRRGDKHHGVEEWKDVREDEERKKIGCLYDCKPIYNQDRVWIDVYTILKSGGNVALKPKNNYVCTKTAYYFKAHIERLFAKKAECARNGNKSGEEFYKLLINAFYGFLNQLVENTENIICHDLKDYQNAKKIGPIITWHNIPELCDGISKKLVITIKPKDGFDRTIKNMGCEVLAWTRLRLNNAIDLFCPNRFNEKGVREQPLYGDTDSLYFPWSQVRAACERNPQKFKEMVGYKELGKLDDDYNKDTFKNFDPLTQSFDRLHPALICNFVSKHRRNYMELVTWPLSMSLGGVEKEGKMVYPKKIAGRSLKSLEEGHRQSVVVKLKGYNLKNALFWDVPDDFADFQFLDSLPKEAPMFGTKILLRAHCKYGGIMLKPGFYTYRVGKWLDLHNNLIVDEVPKTPEFGMKIYLRKSQNQLGGLRYGPHIYSDEGKWERVDDSLKSNDFAMDDFSSVTRNRIRFTSKSFQITKGGLTTRNYLLLLGRSTGSIFRRDQMKTMGLNGCKKHRFISRHDKKAVKENDNELTLLRKGLHEDKPLLQALGCWTLPRGHFLTIKGASYLR